MTNRNQSLSCISSRREFLSAAILAPLTAHLIVPRTTDIRIEEISFGYEDHLYRAPYMFGGRSVDRVTLLNVNCVVKTNDGRTARGFGSMTMGNQWAFPSSVMGYDTTLGAMKVLAERINKIINNYQRNGASDRCFCRARTRISESGGRNFA